jgi:hypothetical protein
MACQVPTFRTTPHAINYPQSSALPTSEVPSFLEDTSHLEGNICRQHEIHTMPRTSPALSICMHLRLRDVSNPEIGSLQRPTVSNPCLSIANQNDVTIAPLLLWLCSHFFYNSGALMEYNLVPYPLSESSATSACPGASRPPT